MLKALYDKKYVKTYKKQSTISRRLNIFLRLVGRHYRLCASRYLDFLKPLLSLFLRKSTNYNNLFLFQKHTSALLSQRTHGQCP